MDPMHEPQPPASSGHAPLSCGVSMYYELRGPASGARTVLLNGAFGLLGHYHELADLLAAKGYNVLIFDWRHFGRSRAGPDEAVTPDHTSNMYASDTLELMDQLWPGEAVHVFGASMGGFIACRLAQLLARQGRLASLYVSASSRGMRWWPKLSTRVFKWLLPYTIKPAPKMVPSMVRDSFSKAYLDTPSPDPRHNGMSMRELWTRRWTEQFDQLFSFGDVDACAAQAPLAVGHYLTDKDVVELRDAGAPITVFVAGADGTFIAPAAQRALGAALGARVVDTGESHMGAMLAAAVEYPKHLEAAGGAGGRSGSAGGGGKSGGREGDPAEAH